MLVSKSLFWFLFSTIFETKQCFMLKMSCMFTFKEFVLRVIQFFTLQRKPSIFAKFWDFIWKIYGNQSLWFPQSIKWWRNSMKLAESVWIFGNTFACSFLHLHCHIALNWVSWRLFYTNDRFIPDLNEILGKFCCSWWIRKYCWIKT